MIKSLFGWLNFDNIEDDKFLYRIDHPKNPNDVNTTWQYKQMRKYSFNKEDLDLVYLLRDICHSNKELFEKCLFQSVLDNDLTLFSKIFEISQNWSYGRYLDNDKALDYALFAMNHDKKEIFEYIINQHSISYGSSCSYDKHHKASNLLENVLIAQKFDYVELLQQYKLANFTHYIEEVFITDGKFLSNIFQYKLDVVKLILEKLVNPM